MLQNRELRITYTSTNPYSGKQIVRTRLAVYGPSAANKTVADATARCLQSIEDDLQTAELSDDFSLRVELLGIAKNKQVFMTSQEQLNSQEQLDKEAALLKALGY